MSTPNSVGSKNRLQNHRDKPVRKHFWEPPLAGQVRASRAVGPPFTHRAYLIQAPHTPSPSKGPTNPRALDMRLTAAEVTPGTNEQRGHGHWGHPETREGQGRIRTFSKKPPPRLSARRRRGARAAAGKG